MIDVMTFKLPKKSAIDVGYLTTMAVCACTCKRGPLSQRDECMP